MRTNAASAGLLGIVLTIVGPTLAGDVLGPRGAHQGEQASQVVPAQVLTPPFGEHECKLLEDTVYRTASVEADARSRLLRASLDWVTQHKNRFDD